MVSSIQSTKLLRIDVLSNCLPDKAFWTIDGQIIHSIYELVKAIETMNDYSFRYHVNKDNNKKDFAVWIKNVLGDEELARRLENVLDKSTYLEIIKDRIKQFEELKST